MPAPFVPFPALTRQPAQVAVLPTGMLTLIRAGARPSPTLVGVDQINAWHDQGGRPYARAFRNRDRFWIDWPGLGLFEFSSTSTLVTVWPDRLADWRIVEQTFQFRLLAVALQAYGWQVLHASAVATDRGVIALCARSGSGKSTLAYALRGRGFQQWADDAVVHRADGGRAISPRLPFSADLREPSREHFAGTWSGEPVPHSPLPSQLPIVGACVLRQEPGVAGRHRMTRLEPAQAFLALLPHAHLLDPGDANATRRLSEQYLDLAGTIPVVEVVYDPAFEHLDFLLDGIEGAVAQPPARTGIKVAR